MFKISVKATGIEMTQAISEYVDKKVKMLEKFFRGHDREVLVEVEVGRTTRHHKSGDIFKAEIHITAEGEDHYAVVETNDLYAAVDEVKDEMAKTLRRNKSRTLTLIRHGGAQIKKLMKWGRRSK